MKKLFLILLLFCVSVSQQKNNYTEVNPLERLKEILLNGECKFNVYELVRENYLEENKFSNSYVDPQTSQIIFLNQNNNIQNIFEEEHKNSWILKQLDYTIVYNIINRDSIIILHNENKRAPNLTIDFNTRNIKLQDSFILVFKKEIQVNDSDHILKSEWSGFYWENESYIEKRIYRNSVTVGALKDSNKIYINITSYINKNKKTFIFISV